LKIGERRLAMTLELSGEEAVLLKVILLAEREDKRVEMHHAKNVDFKAELMTREKILEGILARL
jgi:hypothetical protein